jgi:hypothetical protein
MDFRHRQEIHLTLSCPAFDNYIKMNKEEFIVHVRGLSTQVDFAKHEHLLNIFPKFQYKDFLKCLEMGFDIRKAFMVSDFLFDISRLTPLTIGEAFALIPKYRSIINIIDLCEMVDQEASNAAPS